MPIHYVRDIKYKGFHPIDKQSVIYEINTLIEKFNEDNEMLLNYMWDSRNTKGFTAVTENLFMKKLGDHRNYLLSHLHEIKFNVMKLNDRLSYTREKEFQKFIDSITKNPKKSIETIRKEIFNWYLNEKKFIQDEERKLDTAVEDSAKIEVKKAEASIKTIQEKKRKKSLEKCRELIEHTEKNHKNIDKAARLIVALKMLKSILSRKKGEITQENLQILNDCFKSNRNWSHIQPAKEITYPPIPNSAGITNQAILNFYSVVTDGSTDFIQLIQSYITQI